MSRLFHPDINPGSDKKKELDEVKKAYEILSNPRVRKVFDKNGYSAAMFHLNLQKDAKGIFPEELLNKDNEDLLNEDTDT